jgi:hypothetical protein
MAAIVFSFAVSIRRGTSLGRLNTSIGLRRQACELNFERTRWARGSISTLIPRWYRSRFRGVECLTEMILRQVRDRWGGPDVVPPSMWRKHVAPPFRH